MATKGHDEGLRFRGKKEHLHEQKVADTESNPNSANKKEEIVLITGSFWLTRVVFLRCLTFIYGVAFIVAYFQNKNLIGKNGLLPYYLHLNHIRLHIGNDYILSKLNIAPTIMWFFDYEKHSDILLDAISLIGLGISSFVFIRGASNMIIMFILWILYHSLVNIGQTWYSFGWESQLLETGFLAIFFCPLISISQFPVSNMPSFIVVMCYRWLIFRIMLGAGLIKIRGDQCWLDLTCMNYHYQTQPVPNPMSYFMHQEPVFFHKFETMSNHIIELVLPWLLLMPRPFTMVSGAIQILFQIVLIISGNLSFLNWLTILPSLCCFDDKFWSVLFSSEKLEKVKQVVADSAKQVPSKFSKVRAGVNLVLGCFIGYLSIPVIYNLWSSNQLMNYSFNSLQIVNTYGAFGSVTKQRTEVIFQGTHSRDPYDPSAIWLEYEFKCKPGSVNRRPCLISPYHYRLDWLMWFAAFQNYQHNPWLVHLAGKFLVNDAVATELIARNPFQNTDPPRWIRAEHYRYTFAPWGSDAARKGHWWNRTRIAEYLPPVNIRALRPIFDQFSWKLSSFVRKRRS